MSWLSVIIAFSAFGYYVRCEHKSRKMLSEKGIANLKKVNTLRIWADGSFFTPEGQQLRMRGVIAFFIGMFLSFLIFIISAF